MKIAVRYYTQSGNTRKIAEAIASALELRAESLDEGLNEPVELLFLGSSLYKFGIDPAVKAFVENNADKIGKIALFGTSASGGSTYPQMAAIAAAHGIQLCDSEFKCLGHFLFMHKNRPDENDCAAAAQFARDIAGQLS